MLGYTQADIATLLGVSLATIQRIEVAGCKHLYLLAIEGLAIRALHEGKVVDDIDTLKACLKHALDDKSIS